MATYHPDALLTDHQPAPWGSAVPITYTQRDVLLYAVGIGCHDLRFVYEGHPQFAVFPTFAIRWGGAGLVLDAAALPPSPGPLTIDAERCIELLAPLPLAGTVQVRSRLLAVHPRGKGGAFVEFESEVLDANDVACVRMFTGVFRRGVEQLGDIAPFEGRGHSRSARIDTPSRAPDIDVVANIAPNQAQLYRLSGDYNPLHIDPAAARFGGFDAPILHGLCTYGHCGQILLGALCEGDPARFAALKVRFSSPVMPGDALRVVGWHDGPGRVIFEARVGDRVVVSNAYFNHH
ncbi:MaoC family dehydratase [Rhodoferax sp. UBA5149]|uniref:MaoC family dehydratase n=1 Tax=Rhodoferax sp. UBA5149 TaxID=1947379 RepID=UPI0025F0123D|nr:MaoC family dehydratase [Rhodoferax sp. UBA5149]